MVQLLFAKHMPCSYLLEGSPVGGLAALVGQSHHSIGLADRLPQKTFNEQTVPSLRDRDVDRLPSSPVAFRSDGIHALKLSERDIASCDRVALASSNPLTNRSQQRGIHLAGCARQCIHRQRQFFQKLLQLSLPETFADQSHGN